MPNPLPSPLTSLSPPSVGERLARCTASAALPSPPLPPFSYPPPPVDRKDGIPESEQPPHKRICLSTLGFRYEVKESSTRGRGVDYGFADTIEAEMRHRGIREVGYRIRDTWIDPAEAVPKMASTTLKKVNTRVTKLAELHEHDTQDLYALLEDARDVWIVEKEAYAAREAWAQSVGLSQTVHHELQTLREQVYAQEQIMASVTRQGYNPPPLNTNTPPHHMTPESVQAMIDQDLLRNSTNGDESQNPDFRSKGLCNDLGSAQEEDDRHFVANENKKIDKYISGLPDNIYGNVKFSKPRTLDETIELTNDLMDQKLRTYAERADNKRKTDDTSRKNHGHQQQPFKKQNVAKVYNMGKGERKPYEGSLPKSSGNANVANAQRDGDSQRKWMFRMRSFRTFQERLPEAEEQEWGNRNAQGWVYAVGNAEKNENAQMNPDSNVAT
nr:hypothetical protein [Tanacetum cinerariifolium]